MLRSLVLAHLQTSFPNPDVSIAYIYCDYQDRDAQSALGLLSSILRQMVSQSKKMPVVIKDTFVRHDYGGTALSLSECSKLLAILSTRFRRCFVIADALDENFRNNDDANLLHMPLLEGLEHLRTAAVKGSTVSMFFTSRENDEIKNKLFGCTRQEIRATDHDVDLYILSRIRDASNFRFAKSVIVDAKLETTIVTTLLKNARGM